MRADHDLPEGAATLRAVKAVEALLGAQVGRRVRFRSGSVWRERESFRFEASPQEDEGVTQSFRLGKSVSWHGGVLCSEALSSRPERLDSGTSNCVYLDADRLTDPLEVRPWRAGDRMRPLGMSGTKKVSDLLTDARVPASERKQVRVLCSGGSIVWVVGHRIADDAKVTAETAQVAKFTFAPEAERPSLEEGSPSG